jgi:hypothetical protein
MMMMISTLYIYYQNFQELTPCLLSLCMLRHAMCEKWPSVWSQCHNITDGILSNF